MLRIFVNCKLVVVNLLMTLDLVFQEMNLFKEFQAACEQSSKCGNISNESVHFKNCVAECISPTCYKEIYEFDEVRRWLIVI